MKRALIIEDEKDIQNILKDFLELECGFKEVVCANDGLEGFHLAMSSKFDIITLDQKMPYCHGTEVLNAVRSKSGPNKSTTILFISAFLPQLSPEDKQAENTIFLEKPIDVARFTRYVKMYSAKSGE